MVQPRSLATALAGSVVLLAAPAQAGTITLDYPCYIEQTAMVATGTGYTPGAQITLSGDGAYGTAVADGSGAFTTSLTVPLTGTIGATSADIKTYTLKAQNFADAGQDASVTYRVTNFAVSFANGSRNPRVKRKVSFAGFPIGKAVYGHYRFGGRTRGTIRVGTSRGTCGQLTAKLPLIPAKIGLRTGLWKIQWDTSRTYKAGKGRWPTSTVQIYRVLR